MSRVYFRPKYYIRKELIIDFLVVWAGPETTTGTLEQRMDDVGVDWDITAIGFDIHDIVLEPLVERFEGQSQSFIRQWKSS
jgi:hypothetical protein